MNKEIENLCDSDIYGENVFSIRTMRKYLSDGAYKSLAATMREGRPLNADIAGEVADAMKTWAMERGATHFTHWFQPLTGGTAEKHDSFFTPDHSGGVIAHFSASDLIQGEPDASSFPSGGLRATFEARGYTAWDPTSPAFVRMHESGDAVLCIPCVFCGYHGEALDKKTPLLRSKYALTHQLARMGKLFGVKGKQLPSVTLGVEQEYFLVDLSFFHKRPDLIQTGRTLFGRRPARHQQMEDHYFGRIKPRILAFMAEVDRELWKLGVPAKTRHNEVSPGQFELAPMFEEQNLANDNNMIMMQVLQDVALRHGFACLLHEKPFAGVNGSGKHNNWSIVGTDGRNWLSPGQTPHENAKFLTLLCAVIKGIDMYAPLLRAAAATAGNDHRLGANEAPPAIISIFIGEQLTDIVQQIANGGATRSKSGGHISIGVDTLPPLPRDATDRNRTSPVAFTGNKFEFRAVGSNQNSSGANMALNLVTAAALDDICTELEAGIKDGKDFHDALQKTLQRIIKKHGRVLFDGDGYTASWKIEAKKRGLPDLACTPDALQAYLDPKIVKLFEKYGILTPRELRSRYEVYQHTYSQTIALEGECAANMARTMIYPSAIDWQLHLQKTINLGKGLTLTRSRKILDKLAKLTEALLAKTDALEAALHKGESAAIITAMEHLRAVVDELEGIVPADTWPIPTYRDMFFLA